MPQRPLNIAIVGAGPAGCFTAEELLRCGRPVAITVFERLPQPGGLVRYGVAPDHLNTRRLIRLMERTLAAVTLRTGVEIGREVSLAQLRRTFDAVVIATGAEEERALGIPGEHLAGVHSALAFAGWLNGHPGYAATPIDLGVETAVIIGHGNVALDLVRMLCHPPERLRETATAPAAAEALTQSRIRTIHLVGRRGPAQTSFAENELDEVGGLPGVAMRIDPIVTMPGAADEAELAQPQSDRARAVVAQLRAWASRPPPPAMRQTLSVDFLRRPLGINGDRRVESITLELTRLEGEPGRQVAAPTGSLQRVACGLVLVAAGQRARPLPGLPYDAGQGLIPSVNHRIEPGLYAVGWSTRPPQGLIGHNRRDAAAAVAAILADHG